MQIKYGQNVIYLHSSRNMTTVEIFVSGRVQGVWFRKYSKQKADEIGVCGHVQNMVNGKVKIVAQGGEDQIDQLVAWAKIGSPKSSVESVDVQPIRKELDFEDFRIIKA